MNHASMWLPPSYTHRHVKAVRDAVQAYDANLDFGLNEATGQWCIFIRQGSNWISRENDFPVLGFPDVPHPDDALRKLHRTDAQRRGNEILDEVNRHNDSIIEGYSRKTEDAEGQVAEAFKWGFEKMDKAPYKTVYVPDIPYKEG